MLIQLDAGVLREKLFSREPNVHLYATWRYPGDDWENYHK
jgi:hypothetical protein